MKLKINANRMNLMKYRRRLKFAIRGHKLLKDKQEQLTREFNILIVTLNSLRTQIDAELKQVYSQIKILYSNFPLKLVEQWCDMYSRNQNYVIASKQMYKLNLKYEVLETKKNDTINVLGLITTEPYFNSAVVKLNLLFPKLLQLATLEHLCELMAKDLETTRRRVNALEYVLIPQINGAIRYILDKLNELERTNITQLMRVKQLYGTK